MLKKEDIDSELKGIAERLHTISVRFERAISERDSALTEETVQPITEYPKRPDIRKYDNWRHEYVALPKETALRLVEEWWQKCVEVAKANDIARPINERVRDKAINTMLSLGLPTTVRVLKSSRSSKYEDKTAEWLTALRMMIPTGGFINQVETIRQGLLAEIEESEKKRLQKESEVERERQKEIAKRKADLALVEMCQFVGIDPVESTSRDVMFAILAKDKYLRLAYWLERNRSDWSEGCDFARTGLDEFECDSEDDNAIASEIGELISNWGGDGRCFRDCHWNYSVLYGMADPVWLKAYEKFKESFPEEI